ncbi:MAG TPA: hypothetical protein VH482_33655 [Thermomicrobiales bacterium]
MNATLADGSTIQCADSPLAEGGDGAIYPTTDGTRVVKLYHTPEPWRAKAVEAILTKYNAVRDETYWKPYFAWPEATVAQPRLGVVMRRVTDQIPLSHLVNYTFRTRVLTPHERGDWRGMVVTIIKAARLMRRLHNLGLCHSDLSENNIFVNPTTGQTTLLDCDGLVVPGFLPPAVLGTKGYMAPELMEGTAQPSIRTDCHALAVIIYRGLLVVDPLRGPKKHDADPLVDDRLMYGSQALFIEHPTDPSNRPSFAFPSIDLLGPRMKHLFTQAFIAGLHNPALRPAASEWEQALLRMYDQLVPCPNPACEFGWFVFREESPACPWCGTPLRRPATLPLLYLYRKVGKAWSRDGQYLIAGYHEKTLHLWHATTGLSPGPSVDTTPVADFYLDGDRWLFVNRRLDGLRLVNGAGGPQPIPLNSPLELADDQQLLLGDPDHSRLAVIRLQRLA